MQKPLTRSTLVCVIVSAVLMSLCVRDAWASEQLPTPKEVDRAEKKALKSTRRVEKTAKREQKAVERQRRKREMAREEQELQQLREDIRDKRGSELYENVALFTVGTLFGIFMGRLLPRIHKW